MPATKSKSVTAATTVFSFVGNIGCIRFPPPIRKASGIKRGDRLTVTRTSGGIVLEKLPAAFSLDEETLSVEECACQKPPAVCRGGPEVLTVGWSYVRFAAERATKLGFVAEAPIRLVGETNKIAVFLHPNRRDLKGVDRVACPP